MSKAIVTLGGIPLAGTTGVAWRITAGTAPYTTQVTVHRSQAAAMRALRGQPSTLRVTDSRGGTTTIEQVYVLHEAPSDSPARAMFVIADRRWKWPYRLVVRDYNVPRKTGDRTAFGNVPVETRVTVDLYDYLPYSIQDDGTRWDGRGALSDVLDIVDPGAWEIASLPTGDGESGQVTLQNVTLRDAGDAALARLLSYIPGADVYVAPSGKVVVYDSLDLSAIRDHLAGLPIATRAGDAIVEVQRTAIRPSRVVVHYQREVEALFSYSDDYGGNTSVTPNRNAPYMECVIPTTDPETTITEFDPESGTIASKTVPAGTWVEASQWLELMDSLRPDGAAPWTFETIRAHWITGLEGVLCPTGADLATNASVMARVSALRQHFRQTFRLNQRFMRRVRDIRAVRVALLDPVTGARAPAGVWGQACYVTNDKGARLGREVYRNVDHLAESDAGTPIISTYTSPADVTIVDPELGIIRVDWILPPAGTASSIVPSMLVGEDGEPRVLSRDLAEQDDEPFAFGVRTESAANGIFLDDTMRVRILVTVTPSAPNDARQFHRIPVRADAVRGLFRRDVGIADGSGPDFEVFAPPGEITARYALDQEDPAAATLGALFGLTAEGVEGPDLPGYVLANEGGAVAGQGGARHLTAHSQALAAEILVAFADAPQGSRASVATGTPLALVGNMAAATLRIGAAPSARVDVVRTLPGQQRPVSRFALLPDATRQQVLGTLPFR